MEICVIRVNFANMEQTHRTIELDTVDAYNRIYGFETRHPLVTVVDLKEANGVLGTATIKYGLYAIFLKNGVNCSLRYGRRDYDFQEGTVVSFSPGQVVEVKGDAGNDPHPDVLGVLFHPDLMFGTPLAEKITSFSFFGYSELESLHLSLEERAEFLHCLEMIRHEAERPVDHHSGALLSGYIQVLVEYLHRFYDRQFITRHKVNSGIVDSFQRELREYFKGVQLKHGIPSVGYFADKANLSAGYFSDLIRKETGTSPKDLISLQLLSEAKYRLATGREDISEVAYSLGFEYPAHFSRMFKRMTGKCPSEYRRINN